MSKPIPTIQKFMSTNPHSLAPTQTLAEAHHMMLEFDVRHLPIVSEGKLLGILTDRDLRVAESMMVVDPSRVTVAEVMNNAVYAVSPDAALDEVVATMGKNKYGSAVVMQNSKVVGVFTTVDACQAFAELLHTRLAS